MATRDIGDWGEALARRAAVARGLILVDRNVEVGGAELDLVCREGSEAEPVYVFVEVRSRANDERGLPQETIGRAKQARIRRGACAWLVAHDLWERVPVRFDVVAIIGSPQRPQNSRLEWIVAAFE